MGHSYSEASLEKRVEIEQKMRWFAIGVCASGAVGL